MSWAYWILIIHLIQMVSLNWGLESARTFYYVCNGVFVIIHAVIAIRNQYEWKPNCSPHIRNYLFLDFLISLFSCLNIYVEEWLD